MGSVAIGVLLAASLFLVFLELTGRAVVKREELAAHREARTDQARHIIGLGRELELTREQLEAVRLERKELFQLAMQMRKEGAVGRPEHFDDKWEGGKYVMGVDEESARDPEVVQLERDVREAIQGQL